MQSHDNENRLADLQELATRLTNSYDVRTGTAREVPIVMVPGFSGWGTPLFGAINYWGGVENIPQELAKAGYTVIVTPIAPISSNWERACELYAQLTSGRFSWYDLEKGTFEDDKPSNSRGIWQYPFRRHTSLNNSKGIEVDYGDIFPERYGYERYTTKRKLPIIFTRNRKMWTNWVWSKDKPVHFICHSQGGNTVRYLLHLMENGSRNLTNGTSGSPPAHSKYFGELGRSKWAISVSTIGTPHRGTTVVNAIQEYFREVNIEERTRLIGRLFATLSFSEPNHRFYDLQLDHWGLRKGRNSAGDEESFQEMRNRLESHIYEAQPGPVRRWLDSNHNGLYDNSISGVDDLNNKTTPTFDNIYYFSLSFTCVQQFPANWPQWTLDALRHFPLAIREFLRAIPVIGDLAQLWDNAAILGGFTFAATQTTFLEVLTWALNYLVNPFLRDNGYQIRLPGPPDFLPVPSVFPPMLPVAYAMSSYDLTDHEANILGSDSHTWKVNDGIVNTVSMQGPLNPTGGRHTSHNKELIADASLFPQNAEDIPAAKGKYWHFSSKTGLDHADQIGIFIEQNTARFTMDMYNALVTIISRLPRE